MNGWSKRAEIFGVLVFWGAGLGGIFGALSAMIDSGFEWWVMTRGSFLGSVGVGTLLIPITMFIGTFVGTLVGLLAGVVAGSYAVWARRSNSPEFVAGGIRMRVVEVIVFAAALSTACAAHAHMQATFVQELLAFGLIPGVTALALGWSGSEDVARAYLRHELRERATV
jgi:uncharacterized membrane protein